jgi:hypothetical protein
MLGLVTRHAGAVAAPALGVLLAACATKPTEAPRDYVLAASGIGVAVTAANVRVAPTSGSRAGVGAAGGAMAVMQGVSSDTQFHAIRRQLPLRTPVGG